LSVKNRIKIFAPFLGFEKEEVMCYGMKSEFAYRLTYSCYFGGTIHCGRLAVLVHLKDFQLLSELELKPISKKDAESSRRLLASFPEHIEHEIFITSAHTQQFDQLILTLTPSKREIVAELFVENANQTIRKTTITIKVGQKELTAPLELSDVEPENVWFHTQKCGGPEGIRTLDHSVMSFAQLKQLSSALTN
jgi:hypothetical protein